MKASREETFRPVTLVLETQEEVDALFAVINHNQINKAIGFPDTQYYTLLPFRNKANSDRLHERLMSITK